MEMEMEQLLSMGFPNELAAQALAATGGKSILKATEWILSHKSSSSSNPNPNPSPNTNPCTSPYQPKLDRFFLFQSKPNASSSNSPPPSTNHTQQLQLTNETDDRAGEENVEQCATPVIKRPRLLPPPARSLHEPLSERMRPRIVDDVVGQDQLLGPNSILRSAINCNRLPSIVFWGPPGTGKTSIAKAIVNSTTGSGSSCLYRFVSLSAVTCGVKDVRDAVDEARKMKLKNNGKRTVLFVDEVHRFNKSQQDSFLPFIEDGSIVFVGATTENPSFHLITPLLSRCRVLTLNPLKPQHVRTILERAIHDAVNGLPAGFLADIQVTDDAIDFFCSNCDGDARVALNALEISATTASARLNSQSNCSNSEIIVALDDAKEAFQCKHLAYDKAGEEHYNLISALHKSMRGGDADASIYWLARMLEGGEQPLYIARRLIRFASEDVGLADPAALNQAVACYQACHFLGMPECDVILAQCVAYLALAPKSIAVYRAIGAVKEVIKESVGQNEGVPLHLRNAPTRLMKELGYAKGYIYTPENPSAKQSFLPPSLERYKFLDWPPGNANDE